MIILNFIRVFCMSLADSVTGVSGGTIDFPSSYQGYNK